MYLSLTASWEEKFGVFALIFIYKIIPNSNNNDIEYPDSKQ